eukprot:342043-Hanusia_phi.AAC.2
MRVFEHASAAALLSYSKQNNEARGLRREDKYRRYVTTSQTKGTTHLTEECPHRQPNMQQHGSAVSSRSLCMATCTPSREEPPHAPLRCP